MDEVRIKTDFITVLSPVSILTLLFTWIGRLKFKHKVNYAARCNKSLFYSHFDPSSSVDVLDLGLFGTQ